MDVLRPVNRLLRRFGLLLVPRPYSSGKMLHECANIYEIRFPSMPAECNTVRWLRRVADLEGKR